MKITGWLCAVALSAGLASSSFGQITGTVTLKGTPPQMAQITGIQNTPDCAKQHNGPVFDDKIVSNKAGDLGNVVVYIKTPDGKTLGKASTTPAVLDQVGCLYTPHVIAIAVGQPLTVKNSDMFLHNVHTLPFDNAAVNIGMPTVGSKSLEPLKAVETFKVKCDVHPWMAAWIVVLDNPYFAVSSADSKTLGQFSIDTKDLPDGEYNIVAWQEVYQDLPAQTVKVVGGKATVNFTFDADKKAQAKPINEIHLASANSPACCAAKAVAK